MNFKSAEEVESYLKNLFVEYRFGCEHEKRPEVCHLLGDYYDTIKNEAATAAEIYKQNCEERDHGHSCTKIGNFKIAGKGCDRDFPQAYEYLKKACDLKNARGCFHAGVIALTREELSTDDNRKDVISSGVKFLTRACEEHNLEQACFYLSGIYLTGIKDHFEKNLTEAYKLSLRCCEKENAYACSNVSQMHARGEGVQKNPELASVFRARAETLFKELKGMKNSVEFSSPF